MRDNRETAKLTHPLYSSGFFLTNASIKLVAAVTTPMCWSFSKWMMRLVHSPPGIISGHVRNKRNKHKAADCLTTSMVSPETSSFGMSFENASAMSRLPMFAMHCNAKFTWIGLREFKSFLMLWMINLIRSLFVFTSTEMNKYPCGGRRQMREPKKKIRIERWNGRETVLHLQFVFPSICWTTANWPPPCGRSRCHGPAKI